MDIVFGPVLSRRFGKSLGIDLSPGCKQCNFDCVYCELSPAAPVSGQSDPLPPATILPALDEALRQHRDIDVITVTANGEPTLYPHLEELVEGLKPYRKRARTLILSNASTITDPRIAQLLRRFDIVKLSLDCATPRCFQRIDRPEGGIDVETIKEGIARFARDYRGELVIEILVVRGINDRCEEMEAIGEFLRTIRVHRVDLGSVDRPPAYRVEGVDYARLRELSLCLPPEIPVRITTREGVESVRPESYTETELLHTLSRRPLTPEDTAILMDDASRERLQKLLESGEVEKIEERGVVFYRIAPEKS